MGNNGSAAIVIVLVSKTIMKQVATICLDNINNLILFARRFEGSDITRE